MYSNFSALLMPRINFVLPAGAWVRAWCGGSQLQRRREAAWDCLRYACGGSGRNRDDLALFGTSGTRGFDKGKKKAQCFLELSVSLVNHNDLLTTYHVSFRLR